MKQKLDTGEVVAFGQDMQEVEKLYSCKAVDWDSRIARKGIDKIIKLTNVSLEFDANKLKSIEFKFPYEFKNPVAPYPESWKNFVAIDGRAIYPGMSRDEFVSYLTAWEERAKNLGFVKIDFDNLTAAQYAVSHQHDKFGDSIHISMGPTRRTGGRGLWCDGWHLSFMMDSDLRQPGQKLGQLKSLSAFRDEFNTVARPVDHTLN